MSATVSGTIMDWTAVYSETGEEELILEGLEEMMSPRLTRLVSFMYHHQYRHQPRRISRSFEDDGEFEHHRLFAISVEIEDDASAKSSGSSYDSTKYTLGALYCLSINYIFGVGCLGVPYAFARAGFLLCGSVVIVVTFLSYVTVMWVAECGAYAETLFEAEGQEIVENANIRMEPNGGEIQNGNENTQREKGHSPLERSHSAHSSERSSLLHRKGRQKFDPRHYEVIDLVSFYLGPQHKSLYQISLLALMYIGLLAYTQVFCGAIAALLPTSDGAGITRILPQFIFGSIVIPLSCIELDEQVSVQVIMAFARFFAIFIMVAGSVLGLFLDDRGDSSAHTPYFAPPSEDVEGNCEMSYTACYSGFGVAFSTALFSQLFQHSVPGLLRPLGNDSKKIAKVPFVFGASLLTTCSFYLVLGVTAASYFGADTRSSVNLNFSDLSYGMNPETSPGWVLTCARIASNVVVMFPALDTLSVFPLIANTLGSNLLATSSPGFVKWVLAWIYKCKKVNPSSGTLSVVRQLVGRNQVHESDITDRRSGNIEDKSKMMERAFRISTVFWRVVAAFPPLVASIWADDLSFSLLLSGFAGLYVAFFAPSLLQLKCADNVYSGWHSQKKLVYLVLGFATFSLGMLSIQTRDAWLAMTR